MNIKNTEILNTKVFDCNIFELPKINNRAGNLTSLTGMDHIPFRIKRLYYLYDIPGGEARGGHAHKNLFQLLVAASGSFDVMLDDGINKKIVNLNRPYFGLLIIPGIWREIINFSSGSICLVLSSECYDESDYVRDYIQFKFLKGVRK